MSRSGHRVRLRQVDWAHGRFERGLYPLAEDVDVFLALLQAEV